MHHRLNDVLTKGELWALHEGMDTGIGKAALMSRNNMTTVMMTRGEEEI
jgi:hypothetical protein